MIALAAIGLVGIRPRGIPAWIWATAGAAILIALGAEPLPAALVAVGAQWNVLLFILGLMGVSAAAECSGLFEWIADVLLERAKGSRRRLFTSLFLTGGAVAAVLSNDAMAIVFTPVVYRAVSKRGIAALPYLYACTFVADTASFGMPFSNPTNVLVLPRPNFGHFVLHLGPPAIAAIAINLAIFLYLFRRELRGRYQYEPAEAIGSRRLRTLVAMLALALAYVIALILNWPLGPVALAGAVVVLAVAQVTPSAAAARIGWATFLLLPGLFAIVDAVERAGLLGWALAALHDTEREGKLVTILTAAFGSALASNLMNNLPIAVLSGAIVARGNAGWPAYALIAGVDLGPNLTTTGSLATILWLSILHERGLAVRPLEYLRLGLAVVPAMLVVTSLWLWLVR